MLSSLIADEARRAGQFVDEMAKVYRYLLQTNEQELTPLAVELAFIQLYFHLLKTRHGSGLHLRKPSPTCVESTRVGLANTTARYQLLAQASPLVEDGPAHFVVTVPLLSPA